MMNYVSDYKNIFKPDYDEKIDLYHTMVFNVIILPNEYARDLKIQFVHLMEW